MTTALLEALDRFIEATAEARKRRRLARLERRLQRSLARAFREQGGIFARRFASRRGLFVEVLNPDDWEPLLTAAQLATLRLFELPLSEIAELALAVGAIEAIADLGIEASFNLKNPRAVAYLDEYAARRVAGINATTRDELRRLLTNAVDEGWSYSRTERAIRAEFSGFSRERAHMIAVTEANDGYEAGNRIVAEDLRDSGLPMEHSWLTAGDERVEDICLGNEADGWIPLDDAFSSGHSRPPAHPMCLPGSVIVAASGILATSQRFYEGELVVVQTASGNELTCTPNHPVLTTGGWTPAGRLREGSYVASSGVGNSMRPVDMDDDDAPAMISEVAKAFRGAGDVTARPVPVSAPDFHGDGEGSEVAVIWAYRLLGDGRYPLLRQHPFQRTLTLGDSGLPELARGSRSQQLLHGDYSTARRSMRSFGVAPVLIGAALRRHQPVSVGFVANGDAGFYETPTDHRSHRAVPRRELVLGHTADVRRDDLIVGERRATSDHGAHLSQVTIDSGEREARLARELWDGSAGAVFADEVVAVARRDFAGHVYNLETVSGAYVAGGIVTHNCRCTVLSRMAENR